MQNATQSKRPANKRLVIVGCSLGIGVAALGFHQFVVKPNTNQQPQIVVEKNKENAATIKEEEEKALVVITDDFVRPDAEASQESTPLTQQQMIANATVDKSGVSTDLDRPEIRQAVVAVLSVYQDFLDKMKATPADQRQAVADQYLVDHSSIFSSTFNYASSQSIHLFPQAANLELPVSVSVNSAIFDPDDSNQTIVQIFMPPDTSWSLLVFVKMNEDGTLKTIEKVIIRQNQLPL